MSCAGASMNPALLQSQLADLEEPESAESVITVELGRTPRELIAEIKTRLHLTGKL